MARNSSAISSRLTAQALTGTSFAPLYYGQPGGIPVPTVVERFVGAPVSYVTPLPPRSELVPASLYYLYPDTPDYYYRYGDGYMYRVDRSINLINSLLPLLGGGYLPGQYLPASYMSSYVPAYYGFNSFYPDYGDVRCNRYVYGVVYQVDCYDRHGRGRDPALCGWLWRRADAAVGYAITTCRISIASMYYDTPDYGYWYAPGAIYQYDPRRA